MFQIAASGRRRCFTAVQDGGKCVGNVTRGDGPQVEDSSSSSSMEQYSQGETEATIEAQRVGDPMLAHLQPVVTTPSCDHTATTGGDCTSPSVASDDGGRGGQ
jgi:hypothetical protein